MPAKWTGDADWSPLYAGQSAGLVHDIKPAAEIRERPRLRDRGRLVGPRARSYGRRVSDVRDLLRLTSELAADFVDSLDERAVLPPVDVPALRAALGGPLPEEPIDPATVIAELAADADPGLAATPSGRWFGFVMGGSVPAALAADWLTSAWDQNAGLFGPAPAAAIVEEVSGEWLRELFGLPQGVSFAFVTGCQMAHVTALAAARHHVLREAGWDVNEGGLFGAPPIRVLADLPTFGDFVDFIGLPEVQELEQRYKVIDKEAKT